MAVIQKLLLAESIESIFSADPTTFSGAEFNAALSNTNFYRAGVRGVRICQGETEGKDAISRAFKALQSETSSPTAKLFASAVASAIADAVKDIKADTLLYAHFLFHGIDKPTLKETVDKIRDNGRIIRSSLTNRDKIKIPTGTITLDDKNFIMLTDGSGEDIEGLSFRIYHKDETLPQGRLLLAKCGLIFDFENKTAYVINLQGREVNKYASSQSSVEIEEHSRNIYQHFSSSYPGGPRLKILLKAMEIAAAHGFEIFKAIDPKHHVLYIGRHSGYFANYGPVLDKAGFDKSEEQGLYHVKILAPDIDKP